MFYQMVGVSTTWQRKSARARGGDSSWRPGYIALVPLVALSGVVWTTDSVSATTFSLSSSSAMIADTTDPTEVFLSVPSPPGTFSGATGSISLDDSVSAVNPPNTEVYTFDQMTTSNAGTMFLGDDDGTPVFQFVPNHAYINNLGSGANEPFTFTFQDSGAPGTSVVFTVTVTGVNDKPVVSTFLPDITKDLPSSSFTCETCDFPGGEPPPAAFDDNSASKYLSFDGAGSDVIIDVGSNYVAIALSFITANDFPERDPVEVTIFGSTIGATGPWTLIKSDLGIIPPNGRGEEFGPYAFDNTAEYRFYKIVFDQLRGSGGIFQIAEISIRGTTPSGIARYVTGAPPTIIGGGILLFDDGNARTASATLPNPGSLPGDQLGLAPGTAPGVSADWNATTRTLTITANSQADLAEALKKLAFFSTETDPSSAGPTREVSVTATDQSGLTSDVAILSVQMPAPAAPFTDPDTNQLPVQEPGAFEVYQDGTKLSDVTVEVQNETDLVMSNADFELRLAAQCTSGCIIQTDSSGRQVIELESSGVAQVQGDGFQPGSVVDVWLFSTPNYLGQLPVNGSGTFSGSLPLPSIAPGFHTLQVNGTSADGKLRSANLGVVVKESTSGFEFDYELSERPTTLPDTGGSPLSGLLALLLIVGGVGVYLIRRRSPRGSQ